MKMKYGNLPLHEPKAVYAIGDVHGEYDKLLKLLDKIGTLKSEEHLVFCGDVINRGPKTPQTIELIMDLFQKYPNQIFLLRGNHEHMLINYLAGRNDWVEFLRKTFIQCMTYWEIPSIDGKTYNPIDEYKKRSLIKKELAENGFYYKLINSLPYYETENLIITHAPLDRDYLIRVGLEDYEENYKEKDGNFHYLLDRNVDTMWEIVDENQDIPEIKKILICGHQYKDQNYVRSYKNRLFLDTGVGISSDSELGCVLYDGKINYIIL